MAKQENEEPQNVHIVLTSALNVGGKARKAGTLHEVGKDEAADYLRRGKARLATAEDFQAKPAEQKPEEQKDKKPAK